MGYKKLDEVMELLTDELDGFNKALNKLQRLTKNVKDIRFTKRAFGKGERDI